MCTQDGHTALYSACMRGDVEAVQSLLDYGASIDLQGKVICALGMYLPTYTNSSSGFNCLLGTRVFIKNTRGDISQWVYVYLLCLTYQLNFQLPYL